jgi:hypothetical protein
MMFAALDPSLADLKSRRVIYVKCSCGYEACLLPVRLVGKHGIKWHTKVFGLKDRLQCSRCKRRPERLWIDKWQD